MKRLTTIFTSLLAALSAVVALGAVSPASAETIEVEITLPVRARLHLTGRDSLALAPCVTVNRESE